MEKALRMSKKSRSSSIFKQLAATVGVGACADPAFNKFRDTLRTWFPNYRRARQTLGMASDYRGPGMSRLSVCQNKFSAIQL